MVPLQDQILAEVDTQLTVSSARADAADAQLSAVQGQTDAAQVWGCNTLGAVKHTPLATTSGATLRCSACLGMTLMAQMPSGRGA